MQVEVKPYVREDGVRVEGYVRNVPGGGSASGYVQSHGGKKFQAAGRFKKEGLDLGFSHNKKGKTSFQGQVSPLPNTNLTTSVSRGAKGEFHAAGKVVSDIGEFNIQRSPKGQIILDATANTGLPYNVGVRASAAGTLKSFQATGSLVSDLGDINLSRSKAGKISYDISPNIGGIATAVGEFMRNQAQKATEAPGTVADAATQAAQGVRTATDVIVQPDVSPGVAQAVIGAAAVGAAGTGGIAAPVLLSGAATPSAMSAGAVGAALITTPATAGLLPAAGATVARGGAIALTAAPPVGATTMARAAVPSVVKKAGQTVVPMVGSRGKFKVVDAAGKSLMNNLSKQQAAKMAAQFGQIL
jgi:hypothetical protein